MMRITTIRQVPSPQLKRGSPLEVNLSNFISVFNANSDFRTHPTITIPTAYCMFDAKDLNTGTRTYTIKPSVSIILWILAAGAQKQIATATGISSFADIKNYEQMTPANCELIAGKIYTAGTKNLGKIQSLASGQKIVLASVQAPRHSPRLARAPRHTNKPRP
jgi:hypothetical protein